MSNQFFKAIGDLFQREQVPMAPTPSVVKLDEESVSAPPPMVMDGGVGGGLFGQPEAPMAPTPPPVEQPAHVSEAERALGLAPVPPQPQELPPSLDPVEQDVNLYNANRGDLPMGVIPPEENETISDMEDAMGVNPDVKLGKLRGDRKRKTDAQPARNRTDYAMVAPDVDSASITPEEAAQSQNVVQALTTPESPDKLPAADTAPPVPSPKGGSMNVTSADVKKVAEEDPSGWAKAMSWIQRSFGVTGQDLNRFALLYAGSRIAGYDHSGSMSWSFGVAADGMLNRENVATKMASTGNYTPASVEAYRKTGNMGALKQVGKEKEGIKYDRTKRKYKKGSSQIVYEATLPNGSKTYVDMAGKEYTGDVADPADTDSRSEERETSVGQTVKIMDDHLKRQDKDNPYFVGSPTEDAVVVEDRVDAFRREKGVEIDSGLSARIKGNAMRQAERWAAATGGKVESIAPFIDAQLMYMDNDNMWAQQLRKNGKELHPDDVYKMNDKVMQFAMNAPGFDATKVERGAMLETFMNYAWEAYAALPPEQRNKFESRDGFYTFLNTELGTSKEK